LILHFLYLKKNHFNFIILIYFSRVEDRNVVSVRNKNNSGMQFLINKFEGEGGGGIKIFVFHFLSIIIIFDNIYENKIIKKHIFF
jgi:hypothetical protein